MLMPGQDQRIDSNHAGVNHQRGVTTCSGRRLTAQAHRGKPVLPGLWGGVFPPPAGVAAPVAPIDVEADVDASIQTSATRPDALVPTGKIYRARCFRVPRRGCQIPRSKNSFVQWHVPNVLTFGWLSRSQQCDLKKRQC